MGNGINPNLCRDDAGGCYITYEQDISYPRKIVVERLDRYGYKPWGNNIVIHGIYADQWNARIIADGFNGVIISYIDDYDSGFTASERVRVQRVDSGGNLLWGYNGSLATLMGTSQFSQQICSDGERGCILAWNEENGIVRMQRIDSSGLRMWGDSGMVVASDGSGTLLLASDLVGGSIITWRYQNIQRVDKNGNNLWGPAGLSVGTGIAEIRVDSSQNVYTFGSRFLGVNGGIATWTKNIQKLTPSGQPLWDSLGIIVDTENTNNPSANFSMIVRGDGFVNLAWENNSNDSTSCYIQNILQNGTSQLAFHRTIGSPASTKSHMRISASDQLSSIYSWIDYRTGSTSLFCQKLDSTSQSTWDTNDVAVTLNGFSHYDVIDDGSDGLIAVWFVQSSFTIFAQQVSRFGTLGDVILGIENQKRSLPQEMILFQNYPNPFNPNTTIKYELFGTSRIKLEVFNQLGQTIRVLVNSLQTPGIHELVFNSEHFPSGVYYYKLSTNETFQARKFTILK